MNEVAFVVIAFTITAYVLLDGYDLGVGAAAPLVAPDEGRREAAMHAIGPYWNGNEVWLIAAGAVLFALFPRAYAAAFSGFYLPFMVVLWLLMFRGIAMEVRNHLSSELWHGFWDAAFTSSSVLLIFLFGVSIGNLVRGLPLDPLGHFAGTFDYLLNPYALGVGLFAVAALMQHGMAFLSWRAAPEVRVDSRRWALRAWWLVLTLYLVMTAATFAVRPDILSRPWLLALDPLVSLPALFAVRLCLVRAAAGPAFLASSVFLAAMLCAVAATIFPFLLPSAVPGVGGLTIYAAAPSQPALATGLAWTISGLSLVLVYSIVTVRRLGKEI
jgi:cytochrome bd ubiquinol oxidase subunit II